MGLPRVQEAMIVVVVDDECDFCEIAALEEDARVVLRTRAVVAFFPLEPATLGHTLVIPVEHRPDIWHLDVPLAQTLAEATVRVAHGIRQAMKPDGLNVIQSNGEAATQTVPHLHIHLVPRYKGDSMGRIWPPETRWSEGQKDAAWDRIRDAISEPR